MPYISKGIYTTESSFKIELSYLFNNNLIKKDSIISGVLKWQNKGKTSGSLDFISSFTKTEKYLRLIYSVYDNNCNKLNSLDYRINIVSLKSNLGIGDIYFFECPETKRLCRILYRAYNSYYFKSLKAYQQRIFYPIQTVSKYYYEIQRYKDLETMLNNIYYNKKYFKELYRGMETRAYKRVKRLQEEMKRFELNSMIKISYSLNII